MAQPPWENVQGFSGATAVGAIIIVDLALIANSFADNLFPVIDMYARTSTWAIVVAIPVLSLTYLVGLLSIGAGETVLTWLRFVDTRRLTEDAVALSRQGDFIVGRFQQFRQEAELLAGSMVAFALLALGSGLSSWRILGWRRFLMGTAIAAIVLGSGSAILSVSRHKAAHRLAHAVKNQGPTL
jgi:hypothetical protein